jgi:hypothetical protein
MAGCLTGLIAGFSRIMLLMYWIARPVAMNATFSTFILPCLGFLFLPFTTLMYVWLSWSSSSGAVTGLQGLDWLWLILAVVLDLATIGAAGAANRNRIPAGYPGAMQPQSTTPAPTQPITTQSTAAAPAADKPAEPKP